MVNPLKSIFNKKETSNNKAPYLLKTEEETKIDESKQIQTIAHHFSKILETLGLDLENEDIKDTPLRVAKMYIEESFAGLKSKNRPIVTTFENNSNYNEMLVVKDIEFYSYCEHHFQPFFGKAHIGYFPKQRLIGLSKINRLVKYHSSRPQVQEKLTMEIAGDFKDILETEDIAIFMEATHLCVAARGVKDGSSKTQTSHYAGQFKDKDTREEFLKHFR